MPAGRRFRGGGGVGSVGVEGKIFLAFPFYRKEFGVYEFMRGVEESRVEESRRKSSWYFRFTGRSMEVMRL